MDGYCCLWICARDHDSCSRRAHAIDYPEKVESKSEGHIGLRTETTVSSTFNISDSNSLQWSSRVIVIAIYRLLCLRDLRSSDDPLLDRVLLVAWTQGEMVYSLATAIIPSLMPLLAKMDTGLGALSRDVFVRDTTQQDSGATFKLQSLKQSGGDSRVSKADPRS